MLVALYPEKVRVAIFTANFLSNDWNTKTQGVWFQDFDLKVLDDSDDEAEKPDAAKLAGATNFEADLVQYLSSLGAPVKHFCGELRRFDFSTARVALIPSVPGVHKRAGWNSGRSIPCPLKNMKPFLHKYLRKWTPPAELHRQNAMPHIKSYARFNPSDETAGELDWAIMTSSNLSKAAWGALQKNKTQFMIRSYELGVMFLPQLLQPDATSPPVRLATIGSKAAEHSDVEASEIQPPELLPLPYGFPLATVVLPTDELVRVECAASMTVADLLATLENREATRKSIGAEMNRDEDHESCGDNNCDTDPATELSLGWRKTWLIRGKLTLVRLCSELKGDMVIADEVKELDILDFRYATPDTSGRIPGSNFQQSRAKISPIIRSPLPRMTEEILPMVTTLIPLCQVKQDQNDRIKPMRQTCSVGVEHPPTAMKKSQSEVRLNNLIRNSIVRQSALRRKGARKRPNSRDKRRRLLFTDFQERRQYIKVRKYAERILLQAGMQLIERIQLLQSDVRKLVFLLRDAILGGSALSAEDLLCLAKTMLNSFTHTNAGLRSDSPPVSEDAKETLVRKLSWDVAGNDGGVTIVLEGWVVTAEWGTFWRTQRKEYACLCDNHVLYFFSNRTHCADFVFDLGREREGTVSEASKRMLKDNSPLSQIDLSETDWTVRKSSSQGEDLNQPHRNAFAFFDSKGRMRLILDVITAVEATTWARLISAEISRNKMFARMRELNCTSTSTVNTEDEKSAKIMDPLTVWTEIMTHASATGEHNLLIIPLRSLYSQIDRLNGTARAERYKSWTLNQALKDLQRDRVKINGIHLAGASLEANILALTLEILSCSEQGNKNTVRISRAGEASTSVPSQVMEMIALKFARQVIICSSRTHGGGDILDTLHLLFGNERFCICPDAQSEPIKINIFKAARPGSTLSARITMKMIYRVIPTDSIGPMDDHVTTTVNGAVSVSVAEFSAGGGLGEIAEQSGHREIREFKIAGIYTQTLQCQFIETNGIEGCVQLQYAG
ncbi:unnamed protein product [Phytophthora fragariaefolia]|uniref:Unnamed protein product n=1 Tax=Phytophthora fragariaefolia TaxID=1490495 RepID=A0A9W6XPT5_9STRA|nr:unnamed protein product [Phytophthora fragariaefolia]